MSRFEELVKKGRDTLEPALVFPRSALLPALYVRMRAFACYVACMRRYYGWSPNHPIHSVSVHAVSFHCTNK